MLKNTFLPISIQRGAGKPPLSARVLTTVSLFNRAEIGYPKLLNFQDIAMGRFTPAERLAPPFPIVLVQDIENNTLVHA